MGCSGHQYSAMSGANLTSLLLMLTDACDAGVDKQPQLWHNPWAGLYIVAVCFFLGLFWVNLLQGAIIDNYCRLIEQMGSGALVCCARCAEHAVLSMIS